MRGKKSPFIKFSIPVGGFPAESGIFYTVATGCFYWRTPERVWAGFVFRSIIEMS